MLELFGTDGIRGKANHYPMTPEVALRAGRALIRALGKGNGKRRILIGKDTRMSGDMIEYALAAGICSAGGDAYLCGVLPTPGIAYLTNTTSMDAGVVVSASHNPFTDNGIKFFNSRGFKISREMEADMDQMIQTAAPGADLEKDPESSDVIGRVHLKPAMEDAYADFLSLALPSGGDFLKDLKVVLDCSNGATYRVAPRIFKNLGALVQTIGDRPDGKNINQGCGSQHTDQLRQKVLETRADIGLAFDGDGDRLIAVDETGRTVSGDQILAICARHLKNEGKLTNHRVVSTVMSNVGFHKAMAELGIDLVIADVGDRYVLEQMKATGAVIGGEDSGHMIFLDTHTSGDGILTGLRLIQAMQASATPLSRLADIMTVYPQVLMNVEVAVKMDIYQVPEIKAVISEVEDQLGRQGRVLVRYSGTQPLCRVMVEGPDPGQTRRHCETIVAAIQAQIGLAGATV